MKLSNLIDALVELQNAFGLHKDIDVVDQDGKPLENFRYVDLASKLYLNKE